MVSLGSVAKRARVVIAGGLHSEMREKGLAANAAAAGLSRSPSGAALSLDIH